jgi:hypothetical protein
MSKRKRASATVNIDTCIYAKSWFNPSVHKQPQWIGMVEYTAWVTAKWGPRPPMIACVVPDSSMLFTTQTHKAYPTAEEAIAAARRIPLLDFAAVTNPPKTKKRKNAK